MIMATVKAPTGSQCCHDKFIGPPMNPHYMLPHYSFWSHSFKEGYPALGVHRGSIKGECGSKGEMPRSSLTPKWILSSSSSVAYQNTYPDLWEDPKSSTVWHGMAWHGMAWYGMVWCGMV